MDNPGQFKAGSWLFCPQVTTESKDFSDPLQEKKLESLVAPQSMDLSEFSPARYCISGWNGESLMTPSALNISNLIEELSLEALKLIQDKNILTAGLKRSIFDEFLSYSLSEELAFQNLETPDIFWAHAWDDYSPFQKSILGFLKNYAFRTVTIYIFKIRFITHFCRATKKSYDKTNLLNPSSFIEKIFKKGSSNELKCEALQPNLYSWYRPSVEFQNRIFELAQNFHLISITQMMKICTYSAPEHESEKRRALFADKEFSHALSHKSFGLFLNELLLILPYWLESKQYPRQFSVGQLPRVLNTKFSGKNLSAFILSHWLAQEQNLKARTEEWGELICPSFAGTSFLNGSFVRHCHELQFLSFLSEMSGLQGHDTVKLLSSVMKKKYEQNPSEYQGQCSLLGKESQLFHRVVLNLSDLPPRNPHHALIFRITSEAKNLAPEGLIFALSNQKLFIPSQEDKTRQLLDNFKLEALINFEELQGRGEIPTYLYILRRREDMKNNTIPGFIPGSRKEHCLTFRISGELKTFSKFATWVESLSTFISNPKNLNLPVFQSSCDEDLSFQFHQDFIIDGRMVNSDNEDPHCITHPSFIRSLAQACLPFDRFFRVETIREEQTEDLLGIRFEQKTNYPLLLVVDKSNPEQIRLEICSFETYPAKLEKYGTAYYNYFGLIPKLVDINTNLFREYFTSRIGNQVVQISLGGTPSNLRSRIKGLLVPAFFALTSRPTDAQLHGLKGLTITPSELIELDPQVLEHNLNHVLKIWEDTAKIHPWFSLGLLIQFRQNIEEALSKTQRQKGPALFQNPVISEQLLRLKTVAIYPTQHPDLFVDICTSNPQALNSGLREVSLKTSEDKSCYLELGTSGQALARFHAPQLTLRFVEFILSRAHGMPVGTLLKGLKLPLNEDLEKVVGNYEIVAKSFEQITESCSKLIEATLTKEISRGRQG